MNVAERATPGSLTTDERRALAWLVGWDLFWRTDSDLPTVYGLPARRDEAAALLGA